MRKKKSEKMRKEGKRKIYIFMRKKRENMSCVKIIQPCAIR
jgi:hypothetical protein